MPQRDPTQAWRDVLAAFDRWLAATPLERESVLASLRREQPELAVRLQAMIDADASAEAGGFMAEPAAIEPDTREPRADALAPGRLGAWQLREVIGVGGMGQVWLAERSDGLYQGQAAVKMLSAVMTHGASAARFAREGELLGRLAHPNIARLLDAGLSPDGHRYLVLEHVQGQRLDEWCDTRRLPVEARIVLFMQVCDAVAYAHANLVVHRDLKPANILVTEAGQAKLLDFGVAKLLEDDTDELTRAGSAGLTPEYAAPEQISGGPISTATDVYALGVVLYRLLSGGRPYAAATRSAAGLAREIVDGEPRGLTRAWDGDATALDEAAAARGTTPQRLRQQLHGELETIVAKAMRKRPAERYATVPELRDDLQRHLRHEPIMARTASLGYRARKFVRRHRVQVGALAAVFVALTAGVAATTWQWQAATREAQRTRAVVKVLTDLFTGLSPDESGRAQVPVVDLLRRGWAEAHRGLQADAAMQGEVARPLGLLLAFSGDMANAAEALTLAREHLARSGQTLSRDYVEVAFELGNAERRLGHNDRARELYDEVIRIGAQRNDPSDDKPVYAWAERGLMAQAEGRLDAAREQLEQAAQAAKTGFGVHHGAYAKAMDGLAGIAREQGRWEDARRDYAAVLEAAQGGKPLDVAMARLGAATIEVEMGRFASAVEPLRQATGEMAGLLGEGDTNTLFARAWLAMALFHSGQAEAGLREIDAAQLRAKDSAEPDVRHALQVILARLRLRHGEVGVAEPLLRESLAHFEAGDSGHRGAAERARALVGECELRRGDVAAALRTLTRTADAQRALLGERHADRWPTLMLRALALDAAQGPAAALAEYRAARDMGQALMAPGHPDRVRLQLLADLAAWRAEPGEAARRALQGDFDAYRKALAGRSDLATLSVLEDRILTVPAPRMRSGDLMVLLNF